MASTTSETETTLNGNFKKVYMKGEGIINLIPKGIKFIKKVKFREADKLGEDFNFPVKVQHPQSVTYAAPADGAFALADIVTGQTRNAQVDGSQMLIRDGMDYESAKKAAQGGEKAFVKSTRYMVESMVEQASKRLEIQAFYGGSGIGLGKISSITSVGSGTEDIVITTATWAPHIWSGMIGARLNVYNSSSSVAGVANSLYISAVDVASKELTVVGDITELSAITAGYDIYFATAYAKDFAGVDKIITNTGTLFGINAATYDLWTGSSYSCGSADLTLKKIERGAAVACGKGGLDDDATCWVSLTTWANSISDQAALRVYDSSYKKTYVNGAEALEIYGVNGKITIMPTGYVKEGEAFMIPDNSCFRIGATDLTFKLPGQGGKDDERFFFPMAGYAGFELRAYSHQAIAMKKPAQALKFTGIVNS